MADVRFGALGPLTVWLDDVRVELGGARQRALLALLLVHRREAVNVDVLVDGLWGESPPPTARDSLHNLLGRLRRVLGPGAGDLLVRRGAGYALLAPPDAVDLDVFERLLADGRAALAGGDPLRARRLLESALQEWRGEPFADVAYEPFAVPACERLTAQRTLAREAVLEARLASGDHESAIVELEALVASEPLRERPRALLMVALYRAGRHADALEGYHQARRVLDEQLGLEPPAELRELYRRILAQDASLLLVPEAVGRTQALPAPTTPLVGRETELAAVARLVRQGARLVTLTGPGGVGKTKLAIEAARQLADDVAGGAVFVALSPLAGAGVVPAAIARALDLPEEPGQAAGDTVAAALCERPRLLVLDNLEHLGDAAAAVAALLERAPEARVIATSRVALHVQAEHQVPLDPLAARDGAALFAARSRARGTSIADDDPAALAIARRLDGLPLALELAAARSRLLPPAALLERLDDALGVLTGGPRDLPDRHRALAAAIEWSERLLDERERALFHRLGVFAGSFSLAAAESVAGADLDTLGALVDASLVQPRAAIAGEARFGLLHVVREYASERLAASGDAETVERAHAAWLVALAAHDATDVADGGSTLAVNAAELDNVRAATQRAVARGDGELALRIATAWIPVWRIRGALDELRSQLELALAAAASAPAELRVRGLHEVAVVCARQGDYQAAREHAEVELALALEVGDVLGAVRGQIVVGMGLAEHDPAQAEALFRSAADAADAAGNERAQLTAHTALASHELATGATASAVARLAKGVEWSRSSVHRRPESLAMGLVNLGIAQLVHGDEGPAAASLDDGAALARRVGSTHILAYAGIGLAALAARQERMADAARLAGMAEAMFAAAGAVAEPFEQRLHDASCAAARGRLGDEEWDRLRASGLAAGAAEATGLASTA